MLTIKFVTYGERQPSTFIISGDKISYHQMVAEPNEKIESDFIATFGKEPGPENKNQYSYFGGRITDSENVIIMDFMVMPHTHCYIMNNEGKTVDSFVSHILKD